MLLLLFGWAVWPENWREEDAKPPFENIEPPGMLSVAGAGVEKESLLKMKSGHSSEDDDDGAKVATDKPKG